MKVYVMVKTAQTDVMVIEDMSTACIYGQDCCYTVYTDDLSPVFWMDQVPELLEELTGAKIIHGDTSFSWDWEDCGDLIAKYASFSLIEGFNEIMQDHGLAYARRIAKRECKRIGIDFVETTNPGCSTDYKTALLNFHRRK